MAEADIIIVGLQEVIGYEAMSLLMHAVLMTGLGLLYFYIYGIVTTVGTVDSERKVAA